MWVLIAVAFVEIIELFHIQYDDKYWFKVFCIKVNVLKFQMFYSILFISRHTTMAGYYGIILAVCVSAHLSVCLSVICPSVFLFPEDNFSKCQWIFTTLGVCIDIVEIWFGNVNGQILSIFHRICPQPGLGLLMGKFSQF